MHSSRRSLPVGLSSLVALQLQYSKDTTLESREKFCKRWRNQRFTFIPFPSGNAPECAAEPEVSLVALGAFL